MSLTITPPRSSTRADRPFNPGQRRSADFARAAVFAEFGYRSGRAIDYADFSDRLPNEPPTPSPAVAHK